MAAVSDVAEARLAAVALVDGLGALLRLACGLRRSLDADPSGGCEVAAILDLTRRPLRELAEALVAASGMLDRDPESPRVGS